MRRRGLLVDLAAVLSLEAVSGSFSLNSDSAVDSPVAFGSNEEK